MKTNKKTAMTIAGFDPSGGAGLLADIKTFNALKINNISVATCITAQNTYQVTQIHPLPIKIIEKQIDTLLKDIKPDYVKTGMLYNKEIIQTISKKIRQNQLKTIVDPVMTATSKDSLSKKDYKETLTKEILPLTLILTPNITEAETLSNTKIENINDAKKAIKIIHEKGPSYVLIKGGHLKGQYVTDILYDGNKITTFTLPRIKNKKAHGSGCTLSALITGYLTLGETPQDSVRKAKHSLWNMINKGYIPGKGSDILSFHEKTIQEIPYYFPTRQNFNVWYELKTTVEKIIQILPKDFIAEVGINIGYALENATKYDEICAINGRITKTKKSPRICGKIEFGGSKHVASIILATMSINPEYRSAMNIRYSDELIKKIKKTNLKTSSYDRKLEPKNTESTMEWGTKHAIEKTGYVPDIIYDKGATGKEPMIRILGEKPDNLLKTLHKIIKNCK